MRRRRFAREDALDRWLYTDLYQAALKIEDEQRRLIAVTFVLLTGRLKLRVSEAIHFHQGWLHRRAGLIEIPAFEPCWCEYCYRQAKQNHRDEDPYDNPEERLVNERYRTKNRITRWVPISWSPRIVAAVEAYVDEVGVFPYTHRTATRLLQNHILPNSEFLEPGDLNWRGMRATGDTFWAFSGLGTKARAALGGHRETELGTYSGDSPLMLANNMRVSQGLEPLDITLYDPVTYNAAPLPREPFEDPRNINPLENYDPFEAPPEYNPRADNAPADVDVTITDYDPLAVQQRRPRLDEVKARVRRFEARMEQGDSDCKDPLKQVYEQTEDTGPGQAVLGEFVNEGGE